MLSDAKLRAVSPKDKAFKLSDGQQLYLFVTPQGGKLWRMDYNFDGKRKSLSLGPYPLVSLLEARVKRDDAKRLLAEGIDPSVAKKLKVKANVEASRNTFEKIAREWHEANSPQWAKRHAADVLRSFERETSSPRSAACRSQRLPRPRSLKPCARSRRVRWPTRSNLPSGYVNANAAGWWSTI